MRPAINILAGAALFVVVIMDFFLKNIPEVFSYGHELGEIIYRISLSIISSYVFFFIVVHIKSEQDKKNINVYVAEKVSRIIGNCSQQINELAKNGNATESQLWNDENLIRTTFHSIHPRGKTPLLLAWPTHYADWLQFFDFYRRDTLDVIEKIFRKMPFLDTRLVFLLAKLEDCSHFGSISSMVNLQLRNTDMEPWASCFYKYVQICKELQSYYNEKLKT